MALLTSPGVELVEAQARALELGAVAVDEAGELSLVVLEAPERDLPLSVRLDAGGADGLEVVEDRLDWSAVVDPLATQPRVRVPFRAPSRPGEYTVSAQVDYSVCGERWCVQKQGRVVWTIEVEAGATDGPDGPGPRE